MLRLMLNWKVHRESGFQVDRITIVQHRKKVRSVKGGWLVKNERETA